MLSITKQESQFHVNVLASDDFAGRKTGTPGQWLAAKYIANEFSSYGLAPAGDGLTFYQNFSIAATDLAKAVMWLRTEKVQSPQKLALQISRDFIPVSFTGENKLTAEIVFAGYGISAPEYRYDDYAGLDVRGKIVLVLRHEPQETNPESPFNGRDETRYSHVKTKAETALRNGARGMLIVTDPNGGHGSLEPRGYWPVLHGTSRLPKRWDLDTKPELQKFPVIWIDGRVADLILSPTSTTLQQLQTEIDATLRPLSFAIQNQSVHMEVRLSKEVQRTQNVVAMLPGSDPKLHHEFVVIGAHYDHLGKQHEQIYHGADDNASGTAGLLEIAEAFSESRLRPRRSLLFIAFSAEELGLLGSQYYVENPVRPIENTVSMVNLDMISRNNPNEISVVGTRMSPVLYEINLAANEEVGLDLLYDGEKYFGRSDQANFAKHNIPVIFYNSDTHEDYHRPSDLPEKINSEKLARVARLAFLVAWRIANLNTRPIYQPHHFRD